MARKRGQVIKRGTNVWLVRHYLGRDAEGKKLYASETVHGARTEAEKVLTRLLADRDTAGFVKPNQLTVADFAAEFLKL
jgi:integrase